MTTPQISGKYQFQVDLRGSRLPVSFTIPDIPDTPPSDGHFDPGPSLVVTDEGADSVVTTSDAHVLGAHTDSPDTTTIDIEADRTNILSVSAHLMCYTQPDRV